MRQLTRRTAQLLAGGVPLCFSAMILGAPPVSTARPEVGFKQTDGVLREHTTDPSQVIVTLERTGPTDAPLEVQLQLNPNRGYAENGVDVETVPDTVTISAGESSAEITLTAINDELVEGDEDVQLFVLSSDDYIVNSKAVRASVTIRDNDFWRWAPVRGEPLKPADVAQRKPLPGFDGLLQAPAWMDLAGSIAATDNSVKAELAARFFDGGVFYDSNVASRASLELTLAFDPISGRIVRSHFTSNGAAAGMIPAELAYSCIIDNTGPDTHTATVTVVLAAAVKGDITATGDGFSEVGRKNDPPPKPLNVSVTKTDPAGEFVGAATKFTFVLERFEEDEPTRHP